MSKTTTRSESRATAATPANTLLPRLGLLSVVVFGIAYMSPNVVVSTFGVIAGASSGAAPMAYLIATLAMTLTALSYGNLARRSPASGSGLDLRPQAARLADRVPRRLGHPARLLLPAHGGVVHHRAVHAGAVPRPPGLGVAGPHHRDHHRHQRARHRAGGPGQQG